MDEISSYVDTAIAVLLVLAAIFTAYWTVKNQVNGLGVRVNELEKAHSKLDGEVSTMRDDLRDDRLAIMSMLHNSEKNAADREAKLREQLARIEERINIDRMIESAITKLNRRMGT